MSRLLSVIAAFSLAAASRPHKTSSLALSAAAGEKDVNKLTSFEELGSTAGLEDTLMALLASGEPTAGLSDFVKSIHQLLDLDMKPKVLANLASQQAEVDGLLKAFSRCPAGLAVAQNDAYKFQTTFIRLSWEHRDCRTVQSRLATAGDVCAAGRRAAETSMTSLCKVVTDLDKGAASVSRMCVDNPGETYGQMAARLKVQAALMEVDYGEKKKACADATSALAAKVAQCTAAQTASAAKKVVCDNLQGQTDAYSCAYVRDSAAACDSLDICYAESVASYDAVVKTSRVQEASAKTELRAILQIKCLAQVFSEDEGKREAAIEACKVADYAAQVAEFSLNVASAPRKAACPVPTDGAGSADYKRAQYDVLAANAPAQACTATCCQDDGGLLAYCPANYDKSKRLDCAEVKKSPDYTNKDPGVRQIACMLVGCCWQPLTANSPEPWCFLSPKLGKTYTTRSCSERALKNEEMCRRCQKGVACGSACIEKGLTCDKPIGCACDAPPVPSDEATTAKNRAEEDARQKALPAKTALEQQEQEKLKDTRTMLQELRGEIVNDPSMNAKKLADQLPAKVEKSPQLAEFAALLQPQLIARPSEASAQLLITVTEVGAKLQDSRVQDLLVQEQRAQAAAEAKKVEEQKARDLLEQERLQQVAQQLKKEQDEAELRRRQAEDAARVAADALKAKTQAELEAKNKNDMVLAEKLKQEAVALEAQRAQKVADEQQARLLAEKKKREQAEADRLAVAERLRLQQMEAARLAAEQRKLWLRTAPGKLTVGIISGANLPDTDTWAMGSKPDAFAIISVTKDKLQITPRIDDSYSPRWNWRGDFDVRGGSDILTIDVFDYDCLAAWSVTSWLIGHDRLGSVKLDFRDFRELEPNTETTFTKFIHVGGKGATPSITFSLLWRPTE